MFVLEHFYFRMIENCIAVDKKKLETIKENWKQYILDVADLTDTEKYFIYIRLKVVNKHHMW